MNSTFKEERDLLFRSFLDRHVFRGWDHTLDQPNKSWHNTLELIFTSACNTECTYCYYKNFGDKLNDPKKNTKDKVLHNLYSLMNFLKKNNYRPENLEIFSGEFFNLPYFEEALHIIDDSIDYKANLVIPTNCTFAVSDEKIAKIESILHRFKHLNIFLSLSTDGVYSDNISRPLKSKQLYPEGYYDRLFSFASRNNFSFHPMISPDNIFYWKDTFEWFLQKIQEYFNVSEKEALRYIYLLEVRNPNWNEKSLNALKDFIEYLIDRTFKMFNEDSEKYYDNFLLKKSLNIFSGLLFTTGRGLGCSIQQSFSVRLYDLAIVNCHRTSYDKYLGGYFVEEPDGNLHIVSENPNLYMLINSFDFRRSPQCNECNINAICNLSCIGCNFEVNKDFFIPVKTVCTLEQVKITTILDMFYKKGILQEIIKRDSLHMTHISVENINEKAILLDRAFCLLSYLEHKEKE